MRISNDDLRQRIRHRRRQLGLGARVRAAVRLAKAISATDSYRQSRHIAFYYPMDGELDCQLLIEQAWKDGKYCYLPRLKSKQSCPPMEFAVYFPGAMLKRNRYGIYEPAGKFSLKPQSLDLVITPLVACDKKGNRMGMGGGFYDKSFAFKRARNTGGKTIAPWLLGVAYSFQQQNRISSQPWDVRLDQTIIV